MRIKCGETAQKRPWVRHQRAVIQVPGARAGFLSSHQTFMRTHFLEPGFWEAKLPALPTEGIKGMPEQEVEKL